MKNLKYVIPILTVILISFIPITGMLLETPNALSENFFSGQKAFGTCDQICNLICGPPGNRGCGYTDCGNGTQQCTQDGAEPDPIVIIND